MDTQLCPVHQEEKATAYCPKDGVFYCDQCLTMHYGHQGVKIEEYTMALLTLNQISQIEETEGLISKYKQTVNESFCNTEINLSQTKNKLMMSLPEGINETHSKKTDVIEFRNESENALKIITSYVEINLSTLKEMAW